MTLFPSLGFSKEEQSPSINSAENDLESQKSEKKWNEFDFDSFTLRIGGGFLVDTATYKQDDTSAQQMALSSDLKLRDMRLLFKGKFKYHPNISYTAGYMYDG